MNILLNMILIWILALAITITIHEAAHAWTADRLGDPTARLDGRLTLNPLAHYDRVGTTILLVTAVLTLLNQFPFPFGWAKPVPIDPYNLKNPRRDAALISLAGPLSNIALATLLAIALRFLADPVFAFIYPVILLNVALAVFNLVPVHPLDGGKILVGILPTKAAHETEMFLERYGMLVLILLVFPVFGGFSIISAIVGPLINIIVGLLVPGSSLI